MNTRDQIIEAADLLQRRRGYAGWSFGDISAQVGVRRASIHHHFPSKGALLAAVVEHKLQEAQAVATHLAGQPPAAQLRRFLSGYSAFLASDALCPGGALSVDLPGLSEDASQAALRYLAALRAWLVALLDQGQAQGAIARFATPDAQADLVLSAVQGALQQARATQDFTHLDNVIHLLEQILLETK